MQSSRLTYVKNPDVTPVAEDGRGSLARGPSYPVDGEVLRSSYLLRQTSKNAWRKRFFEVRGHFLIYRAHSTSQQPSGMFDLTRIQSVALNDIELVLTSTSGSEYRLRPTRGAGQGMAFMREWESCLHVIVDSNNLLPHHHNPSLASSGGVELTSGGASSRVVMRETRSALTEDLEDQQAEQSLGEHSQQLNHHQQQRGLLPCATLVTGGNGDDDGEVVFLDDRQGEEDGWHRRDDRAFLVDEEEEEDGDDGACKRDVEEDTSMPRMMPEMLQLLGAIPREARKPEHRWRWRVYMKFIRFLIYLTCFYLILFSPYQEYLARKHQHKSCEDSLASDFPCFFVALEYMHVPAYGIAALSTYTWLLWYGRQPKQLLRSHHERISNYLSGLLVPLAAWWVVSSLLFMLFDELTIWAFAEGRFSDGRRNRVMGLIAMNSVLINLTTLPCVCFIALFFAETVRLRLVMDDFLVELRTQPLSFRRVSEAHQAIVGEFDVVQGRYGLAASLYLAGTGLSLVSSLCVGLFAHKLELSHWDKYSISMYVIFFGPTIVGLVYAMDSANSKADEVKDATFALLLDPALRPKDVSSSLALVRLAECVQERHRALTMLGWQISLTDIFKMIFLVVIIEVFSYLGFNLSDFI